jgi:hypothetical protein
VKVSERFRIVLGVTCVKEAGLKSRLFCCTVASGSFHFCLSWIIFPPCVVVTVRARFWSITTKTEHRISALTRGKFLEMTDEIKE